MSVQPNLRHPLSAVFLLHGLLEAPLIVQGLWFPQSLPFLGMNNTTLVLVKLLNAISLGTCITSLLCYKFFPGKRAVAMGLSLYHTVVFTVLLQAPRFIPISFGPQFEANNLTPEIAWGILHGIIGLAFGFWWQATVGVAQAARNIKTQ
ncbi:hypothetical protein BJ322DRAFT_1106328 [Thelephora terrestris]|uniref:Uncharacterized protein n=1 Tax=Thelephora terrestris TaxID=56493 RepID=A0A9P6HJW6_9AGAM|nr:hypothetical protein BJ322DRAFT_1106328 [Thelephora terrestris]